MAPNSTPSCLLRFFGLLSLVVHAIAATAPATSSTKPFCTSQSQPNPIAAEYPKLTTGTVNGTIAILPISYALARSLIPAEYSILVDAYQKWLPHLPKHLYPAVFQTELDHNIVSGPFSIPDFSRASISFPFVDRLSDKSTPFIWGNQILVSASNVIAIMGAMAYGNNVTNATFSPPCDAYAHAIGGGTYFNAYPIGHTHSAPAIGTVFAPLRGRDRSPYSLDFWKNVTNQPGFSTNAKVCDNFIRLFNSSVTTGKFAPVAVKGTVSVQPPFLTPDKPKIWKGVYGLRLDNAFIENNFIPCENLRGYHGTGGDGD